MPARPTPTSPARGLAVGVAGALVVGLLALAGCSDDVDWVRPSSEALEPAADLEGTLGRVHVILQPQPGALEPEPQLQISGRFVEYRGVPEDFVRARANLPVAVWDERLSTAAVQRLLIDEADMTRARRAEVVDKMAAAYILQGALDALAEVRPARPEG